jgi:hypothetical protein
LLCVGVVRHAMDPATIRGLVRGRGADEAASPVVH